MTKQEKNKGYFIYSFNNGYYKYRDKDWIAHLIKSWEYIVSWISVWWYDNGDYSYKDKDWIAHLVRNWKKIASWVYVSSYNNGDYSYEDEEGNVHYFNKNWEEIEK